MNENTIIIICIVVLIILMTGNPDLLDAIIERISCKN